MNNAMRGIFIKNEQFQHIDLLDTTKKERISFYNSLSKGQVVHILEQFVENKMMEENKI